MKVDHEGIMVVDHAGNHVCNPDRRHDGDHCKYQIVSTISHHHEKD